jgi:hypothetical protein
MYYLNTRTAANKITPAACLASATSGNADAPATHQITILYDYNYDIRHVRTNEPHPVKRSESGPQQAFGIWPQYVA